VNHNTPVFIKSEATARFGLGFEPQIAPSPRGPPIPINTSLPANWHLNPQVMLSLEVKFKNLQQHSAHRVMTFKGEAWRNAEHRDARVPRVEQQQQQLEVGDSAENISDPIRFRGDSKLHKSQLCSQRMTHSS